MNTQVSSSVKVHKSLTGIQAASLRTAIYAKFSSLVGNVQIITSCGVVLVTGIRGYAIDPAIADRLHCLISGFDTTPSDEAVVALDTYLSMVAVSGYKAPSKRSRSICRMGGAR